MARSLAAAVLNQAWKDATQPPFLGKRRIYLGTKWVEVLIINVTTEQAVDFLVHENPTLDFWSSVAGVSSEAIRTRAGKALQRKRAALAMARRQGAMGA